MEPLADKRRNGIGAAVACMVGLVLLALTCCVLFIAKSRSSTAMHSQAKSLFSDASRETEGAAGSSSRIEGGVPNAQPGGAGDHVSSFGEAEMAELSCMVSAMLAAYSNREVRILRTTSRSVWNFMTSRKQQIPGEICMQIIAPVRQVLFDHYSMSHADAADFQSSEELDAYLDSDMEQSAFFCDVSVEWHVFDSYSFFEWLPLRMIDGYRKIYVRDGRAGMVGVCDKWISSWHERIDSEAGYLRNSLKCSSEKALQFVDPNGIQGNEIRASAYRCAKEFSKISGYTPKWISEYAPAGPKTR